MTQRKSWTNSKNIAKKSLAIWGHCILGYLIFILAICAVALAVGAVSWLFSL